VVSKTKDINDKKALIIACIALALGIASVVIFTTTKESNQTATLIATLMLYAGALIITWVKFYFDIRPIWIGIVLTVFLFLLVITILFTMKHFNLDLGNLVAIPVVFAAALLINRFQPHIVNFLLKVFKNK